MPAFTKSNLNSKPSSLSKKAGSTPFFGVQAKLSIGKPNDKYEKEADSVADKVVAKSTKQDSFFGGETFFPSASPKPSVQKSPVEEVQKQEDSEEIQEKPLAESITPVVQLATDDDEIQEKCDACEGEEQQVQTMPFEEVQQKEDEEIQPQANEEEQIQEKCEACEGEAPQIQTMPFEDVQLKSNAPKPSSSNLENTLSSTKGQGSAMDNSTKSQMESGFGSDFSNVRIHTNSTAVQMNQDLGAQAFANGSDIYFNQGKYNPSSQSGQHLLAHELTHTIQQGASSNKAQTAIQLTPNSDIAEEVIYRLEGWTSSADSGEILAYFSGKSSSDVLSILDYLKNGEFSSYTGYDMFYWLLWDLVAEDRKALINIMIRARSEDVILFIAKTIIDEHISGYTSEADSTAIYDYFRSLDKAQVFLLLTKMKTELAGTIASTSAYLFDDLTLTVAENLKNLLFAYGEEAAEYAATFTAKKIENLIAGYTGVSDSQAIVANFDRVSGPTVNKTHVLNKLNEATLSRWGLSAEDSLMEDMYESDYNALIDLGLPLAAYKIDKHWLKWGWDKMVTGFDYVAGWIQYGVCGIAGALWGVVMSFYELIKVVLQFVFIGIPDLIGWIIFHVTSGTVGREEYNNVNTFFSGIGQLFNAPGDLMSKLWTEVTTEASLIEGPFAECQTAFYWTSRIFRVLTDVVLIFLGGYGIIKGLISGAKTAVTLARAGKWGELMLKIITKPGRLIGEAGTSMARLIRLLTQPAKTIEATKAIWSSIRTIANDEGLYVYLRTQAGGIAEAESIFWKEHRSGWLKAAAEGDAEILALEESVGKILEPATTPDEAGLLIDNVDDGARLAQERAQKLLDDIENGVAAAPEVVASPLAIEVAETLSMDATLLVGFTEAELTELQSILGNFAVKLSRDRITGIRNFMTANINKGRASSKIVQSCRNMSELDAAQLDAMLKEFTNLPPRTGPWRGKTIMEDGNAKEGWQHIDARHVTGDAPGGAGDLFPAGTTRAELEKVAQAVVDTGTRISTNQAKKMQTFSKHMKVNGEYMRVNVTVETTDGRIITMFPNITGP